MPRGKPKESKNKVIKQDITIEKDIIIEQPKIIEKKDKILKVNYNCDLCNSPIYSSPYRIQLQNITGKAPWHRDCKVEKLQICDNCAKELNDIIDKYILKKNPSLSKW